MITIDGKTYKVEWVADSFKRKAEILNGENSGRLQGTGAMFLEYVGTFFNFSGQIVKNTACSDEEWNEFYEVLSNPINKHIVTVPFGNDTMTAEIYISRVEQTLRRKTRDGKNKWANVIDVSLVATESQWLAGQSGIKMR